MASDPFPRAFGKYTLMSHLAVGGMADVFLATQRGPAGFEKDCVIKLILPSLAQDEAFVRMFLDEARIAARLSHPNIVQVFDFGQEGGDYFISLEHVDGLTLERLLAATAKKGLKGLPWPIAVRIVAGIAEGLDHAHRATASDGSPLHLVHRDVSPTNIMVGWNGVAKILDFGIAKVAAHRFQRNTEVGVVKGKVPYMSPEQIEGLELDARSDVFALGAVLYEATTGQRAFPGSTASEVTQLIAEHDPLPPEELNPSFPPDLKTILFRALSKTVQGRYQSARDFKLDLEQFLQDQHVSCTSYDVVASMEELVPRKARGTLLGVGPQRPLSPQPSPTPSSRTPSPQSLGSAAAREPAMSQNTDGPGFDGAADEEPDERPIKPAESSRESRRTPRPARVLPNESSGALRAANFDLEAEEQRHRAKPKGGSSVVMGVIAVLVLITAVIFYILHTRAVQRAEQGTPPATTPSTTPPVGTTTTPPSGPAATGATATPPSTGSPPPAGAAGSNIKSAGTPAAPKPPEKAADKPGDKPAAKPPEKAPDRAADKPAPKPAERPRPKKADDDEAPRALPKLPVPPPADPE